MFIAEANRHYSHILQVYLLLLGYPDGLKETSK